MANLKNGSIREMVIDRCLSDKNRKYSTKDIMIACNKALSLEGYEEVTSLNTIRSDIRSIEQRWCAHGGKVTEETNGRNKFYHYEDLNFSIYKTGLTADELNKLNQTLMVLSRFEGLPQFEWITEINTRFKSTVMASTLSNSIISFEDNIDAEGRQHITTLFNAIAEKNTIEINYQKFIDTKPIKHIVHPYYLKQYNSRWFLLGMDEYMNLLTVFPLDRILTIDSCHKPYIENIEIDFTEYFYEVIGVTVKPKEKVQPIKMWVSKEQYPYIRTKPLHGTQKVIEYHEDGSVVIQIEVRENYELIQKLLSFGEKVVVVSPDNIRRKIQERIWLAGENYNMLK